MHTQCQIRLMPSADVVSDEPQMVKYNVQN